MTLFFPPRARRIVGATCLIALLATVGACASERSPRTRVEGNQHYVSGTSGPPPIDVKAVEQAFWATQDQDFATWMGAFEQRVNEIYDGNGIVSLDARQDSRNLLTVTGFLEKNDTEGFQAGQDHQLFAIEQTDAVSDNRMPYRVSGYGYDDYLYGHHVFGSPLIAGMLMGSLLNRPYYTPRERVVVLQDHRRTYRQTPTYQQARRTRMRTFGTTTSRRSFGTTATGTTTTKKRNWLGRLSGSSASGNSASGGSSASSWSGRRSSATAKPSNSWSNRRSSSSGWSSRSSSSSSRRSSSWGSRRSGRRR